MSGRKSCTWPVSTLQIVRGADQTITLRPFSFCKKKNSLTFKWEQQQRTRHELSRWPFDANLVSLKFHSSVVPMIDLCTEESWRSWWTALYLYNRVTVDHFNDLKVNVRHIIWVNCYGYSWRVAFRWQMRRAALFNELKDITCTTIHQMVWNNWKKVDFSCKRESPHSRKCCAIGEMTAKISLSTSRAGDIWWIYATTKERKRKEWTNGSQKTVHKWLQMSCTLRARECGLR